MMVYSLQSNESLFNLESCLSNPFFENLVILSSFNKDYFLQYFIFYYRVLTKSTKDFLA